MAATDPVLAQRLAAQGLTTPSATSPEEVVRRLLAVQGQDPRGARLSIRARSTGLSVQDVDEALDGRRLIVSWLNRGTLHLVTADDYWWLHPLTTPQLATGNTRRLRQEGVSPAQAERGAEVIVQAVTSEGPQTRAELRARLEAAGVPTAGQAVVHLLVLATLRGRVVRGPMRGGEQAFVDVRDWLGEPPEPLDRPTALGRLALRYLTGHGPADARDLAKWAGIPLTQARRGLEVAKEHLRDRPDGLVELATTDPEHTRRPRWPQPRLLGAFDPVLLGWASREPVVGRHHQLVTSSGLFRPFALVNGKASALWRIAERAVTLQPLEQVRPTAARALASDAAAVLRFLSLEPRPFETS